MLERLHDEFAYQSSRFADGLGQFVVEPLEAALKRGSMSLLSRRTSSALITLMLRQGRLKNASGLIRTPDPNALTRQRRVAASVSYVLLFWPVKAHWQGTTVCGRFR